MADSAVAPLFDRLDASADAAQLLVVTSDAEAAAGVASRLLPAAAGAGLRMLPVTESRRAARVLRAAPAQVVIGPPAPLLALVQSAVLKLDAVRVAVLAWVTELSASDNAALEALMGEVPKDAARVVLVDSVTPAADQLVERYARRARRMQPVAGDSAPVSLSFVSTSETARPAVLRRVLDAIDPESAVVIARDRGARSEVEAVLRSLGYDGRSNAVRLADTTEGGAQLVVIYDLPSGGEELRRSVRDAGSARVVALVSPRQIPALKRLAGGSVTPLSLPEAAARARGREEALRDELREVLASGQFGRELLALEALLSDYDGAEVAAAALRLLEAERARPRAAAGGSAQPAMTRLYLNVGEMDGVRAGDLVGAITNEAGISKAELGRVEVRERGSTVEVATAVANSVISKLHGVTIRGRRVLVKIDEQRPRRDGPDDARFGDERGRRDRAGRGAPGRPGRDRARGAPAKPRSGEPGAR